MGEEVIGTIEVVLLVLGLTALVKSLGLQGRSVIVAAMVIATVLGGVSYAMSEGVLVGTAAVWARIVVGALWVGVKGLAAAGLVKFGREEVQRAVRALVVPDRLPHEPSLQELWLAARDREQARRREERQTSGCDPPEVRIP